MNEANVQQLAEDQEQELLELLREVDAQAGRQESRWAEKRTHPRRPMRTPCELRFIGPDGEAVLYTIGKTREISEGGLSLVSREHFARRTPLLIAISIVSGTRRFLPAKVVYSRSVREGWYRSFTRVSPSASSAFSAVRLCRIGGVSEFGPCAG